MGGDIEGHRRGYNGGHGAHKMGHMSRLRACGPVVPGIPQLARVDLARYASGRYGDQVRYGDGILFLFGRAHALATPKGGGPCPLGTLYYLVVGHLDSRLR